MLTTAVLAFPGALLRAPAPRMAAAVASTPFAPGTLARQVRTLAGQGELTGLKVFTSRDETLCLNVFNFDTAAPDSCFEAEEALYAAERLAERPRVEYHDNRGCVALLEATNEKLGRDYVHRDAVACGEIDH